MYFGGLANGFVKSLIARFNPFDSVTNVVAYAWVILMEITLLFMSVQLIKQTAISLQTATYSWTRYLGGRTPDSQSSEPGSNPPKVDTVAKIGHFRSLH